MSYWDDDEREEGTLTHVEGPHRGYYSVTSSNGWSCGVSAEYGVAPRVGDHFVTWGGIGRTVRGQAINHQILYYRTPDEQRAKDQRASDRMKAERIAEYESKRSEYDAKVAALPEPLRERIDGFRAFKPEWRWEFELYELACCEEAARLVAHFKTGDEIKAFAQINHEQQVTVYPEMSRDHSGNTWGMSLRLAWLLADKPDLVANAHGALCPLVGCKDYGCFASRGDAPPSTENEHG